MKNQVLTAIGIAATLLFSQHTAAAQDRNGDRGGQYNSSDARQHGYEHGYRDGADRGRQDQERSGVRNFRDNDYLAGARDYDPSFGDRRQFMSGYQEGYQAGYDDGFNDRGGRYGQLYSNGRGGNRGGNDRGRGNNSPDATFDSGYSQGVAAGQQDQRQNQRSDYRSGRGYQNGDAHFQDGFERGYQDGYGRTRIAQDGGGYFPPQGRSGAADTRDGQGPQTRTITVPANQLWTPTSIRVNQGDRLTLSTTGQIQLRPNDPKDVAISAGSLTQRLAPNSPLPKALAGALIGRIDSGQPFGIGNQTSIVAPASGLLYLGINDDVVSDNSGQFQVTLSW